MTTRSEIESQSEHLGEGANASDPSSVSERQIHKAVNRLNT
jgi:hypothetical protein